MGKVIVIPEVYLLFLAIQTSKTRSVKKVQFERLKELIRLEIKKQFRGMTAFTKNERVEANFYIENGEFKTSIVIGFDDMSNQYRNELVENIQHAFDTSYYQAKEVLTCTLTKWKG